MACVVFPCWKTTLPAFFHLPLGLLQVQNLFHEGYPPSHRLPLFYTGPLAIMHLEKLPPRSRSPQGFLQRSFDVFYVPPSVFGIRHDTAVPVLTVPLYHLVRERQGEGPFESSPNIGFWLSRPRGLLPEKSSWHGPGKIIPGAAAPVLLSACGQACRNPLLRYSSFPADHAVFSLRRDN